jgi:hypothetical protein
MTPLLESARKGEKMVGIKLAGVNRHRTAYDHQLATLIADIE